MPNLTTRLIKYYKQKQYTDTNVYIAVCKQPTVSKSHLKFYIEKTQDYWFFPGVWLYCICPKEGE